MKSKANIVFLKTENQPEPKFDWFKWLLVLIILLAGIVANHYYSETSWILRSLIGVVLVGLVGIIVFRTQKGKVFLGFFRDSRMELRKVIWPTREETMQTTLVVAAMVIILALLLWGMDSILVWIIGWLTGQHG